MSDDWDQLGSEPDFDSFEANREAYEQRVRDLLEQKNRLRKGGGDDRWEAQHEKGRLTARERLNLLLDDTAEFLEIGLMAASDDEDDFPAAGVVTGLGTVAERVVAVVAHDATVKAGSHIQLTCRKTIRMQKMARRLDIPVVYLVDSSGIFLPRQEEVFADEGHFGSIFYQNSRLSAEGIPQIAAIMGPCVAGGAYLPTLCDEVLMVEGAHLFIAGPRLVKAAIGQEIDPDELGGADLHEVDSGTVDDRYPDDESCLEGVRERVADLPEQRSYLSLEEPASPGRSPDELYGYLSDEKQFEYDMREVLARLVDGGRFREFRRDYGPTLICGDARVGGVPVGIVANQRRREEYREELRMGGVIYPEDADKAARYVMRCAQNGRPLLFCQDVAGFMIGLEAEKEGIIKRGSKMVHAISNAQVPKVTLIVGRSHGAGNYALCGRAFNPDLLFAWPGAKIGVMGGTQASETLYELTGGTEEEQADAEEAKQRIRDEYEEQMEVTYGASRMWVDDVVDPAETPEILGRAFRWLTRMPEPESHFGNLQT
jgi:3-methylcrotonyl-CoA carboxylase beta subunit